MSETSRARRLLREPLVHFLIAGAAIFALFAWIGEPVDPADRTITLDREQQALIALDFERMTQRPPTDAELDGLIERWVREEILYREALRLGLDDRDPVVRRRMAKKMDFIAASQADLAKPDGAELREWYEANAARFSEDGQVSFEQRYFTEQAPALAAMESGAGGEPSSLPASLTDRPLRDVEAQFGAAFADALARLAPGEEWQGPVRSGLGWHLVRLTSLEAGAAPDFAEIRDQVEDEWRLSEGEARREAAYRVFADAYTVEIAE
ncbi:peptidyl-prolyl cis-trans isomerase [Qipengyuania sp. DSG2-2]|uniref:peptidylprolyl isomerase n=1 Tax=Qipengyuania sp. DGS2-2 TaxID=3349631 RepID=UPI0036D2FDB7